LNFLLFSFSGIGKLILAALSYLRCQRLPLNNYFAETSKFWIYTIVSKIFTEIKHKKFADFFLRPTVECVGHSFANVAYFVFMRDVYIQTQRAAVAGRRDTNLATHPIAIMTMQNFFIFIIIFTVNSLCLFWFTFTFRENQRIVLAPTTPFTAGLQMENQRADTCPVPGLRILLEYSTNVVFTGVNRVYRLKIQSVMLVFSTPSCQLAPLQPLLIGSLPPSFPIPWMIKYSGKKNCIKSQKKA
jgi:hypothetical protein